VGALGGVGASAAETRGTDGAGLAAAAGGCRPVAARRLHLTAEVPDLVATLGIMGMPATIMPGIAPEPTGIAGAGPAIVALPVPQALRSADPFQVIAGPCGIELHLLQTERFRSTLLSWVAEAPLDAGRAARALLPDLLTRGTARSPGLAAMAARCEELYAADLASQVSGHGRRQLLRLGFEIVGDRHVGGRPLFAETVALLAEVLHDPPLVEGRFRAEHVSQERNNLVHAIEALSDDKATYAYRRMIEAMHAGTPFALHSWGRVDEARAVTEPMVRAAWGELAASLPVRMLVVGDVTPQAALRAAGVLAGSSVHAPPGSAAAPPPDPGRSVQRLREQQPLAQSKLVLGFRVRPELLRGAAAPLFGLAFGGDSHSRLFKRVREAESLAYGCAAWVGVSNATLVVQAGIDARAAERVEQLVLEELVRLAQGDLAADELELSRRAYQRQLRNLADHPRGHAGWRLDALLEGRTPVVAEALEQAARVTPADVAAVAQGCRLDTVFLLEGSLP
jgi:predicted Zn-dependent peptidase